MGTLLRQMMLGFFGLALVLAGCPNNTTVECGEIPGQGQGVAEVQWQPSKDSRVQGYKVHRGTSPGKYTSTVDVGNRTSCVAAYLHSGTTYYFAVSSYGQDGESPPSQEVSKSIP